jgi:hypothetical protein
MKTKTNFPKSLAIGLLGIAFFLLWCRMGTGRYHPGRLAGHHHPGEGQGRK